MSDNMTEQNKEKQKQIEAAAAELVAAQLVVARIAAELEAVPGFVSRAAVALSREQWDELQAALVAWRDSGKRFLLIANAIEFSQDDRHDHGHPKSVTP